MSTSSPPPDTSPRRFANPPIEIEAYHVPNFWGKTSLAFKFESRLTSEADLKILEQAVVKAIARAARDVEKAILLEIQQPNQIEQTK